MSKHPHPHAHSTPTSGIWTALITPFLADGAIDWHAYERLLIRQADAGIRGVVLAGTTGESPTLRVQEKISLLRKAKALVGERLQIMAGVGEQSTEATIELAKLARDAGADSIMVVTPPYNKPNDQGMLLHFTSVAESVELPLCVYHNPGRTAQKLRVELLAAICAHPRISLVKEASGDLAYFSASTQHCKAEIFTGDDPTYLASLAVGGAGCISVVSNVFPREMQLIHEWWQSGNTKAALWMHNILFPLIQALFWETNPCPVKAALAEMNLCANVLRLPLAPITTEHQRDLRAIIGQTMEKLAEEQMYAAK